MANKQAKTHRNAKGVLIELSKVQKHPQAAKGWPINQQKKLRYTKRVLIELSKVQKHVQPEQGRPINHQKRTEMLKECLLSNQKCRIIRKQLKGDQSTSKNALKR